MESALLDAGLTPVYFDCVAAEAISAAARRLREKDRAAEVPALIDRLNDRVPQENLTWILPDVPDFYHSALEIMRASIWEDIERPLDLARFGQGRTAYGAEGRAGRRTVTSVPSPGAVWM